MSCKVIVHFKGGSMGGEVRAIPESEIYGGRLRYPVYIGGASGAVGAFSTPPQILYEVDEYRVERRTSPDEWEARWIRPKDLSRELSQVRGELKLIEAKLAAADDLIGNLKKVKKALLKVTGI